MNICLICTKYDVSGESPWLTNELVTEFSLLGHKIDVVVVDWSGRYEKQIVKQSESVTVYVSPKKENKKLGVFSKILKWSTASYSARKMYMKNVDPKSIDLLVSFSPSITDFYFINYFKKRYGLKSFHILWDFFPIHHAQIGQFPNDFVKFVAYKIETFMLKQHDFIGLMTDKNIQFYRNNYPVLEYQKLIKFPVWGTSVPETLYITEVLDDFVLPRDKIIVVFGGQITKGRGVEKIEILLDDRQIKQVDLHFVVIGDGDYWQSINKKFSTYKNVSVFKRIPRKKYKKLLMSSHIGLIITDPTTTVPTFPSKVIDYFDASIPVISHLEKTTDFGEIVEYEAMAGLSSYSDDYQGLINNILKLYNNSIMRYQMGASGKKYLMNNLLTKYRAKQIIDEISGE